MKEVQPGKNRYRPGRWLHSLLLSMLLAPAVASAHDTLDFNAIQGIFRSSCGGGACHINQATSGVNLTSYETLMASTGVQYGGPVVVAGSPSRSPLIDKVLMPTPEHGSHLYRAAGRARHLQHRRPDALGCPAAAARSTRPRAPQELVRGGSPKDSPEEPRSFQGRPRRLPEPSKPPPRITPASAISLLLRPLTPPKCRLGASVGLLGRSGRLQSRPLTSSCHFRRHFTAPGAVLDAF